MENIFIILFGLSMIYISAIGRFRAHINMLALQGILLFFISLSGFMKENDAHILEIIFIVFETLAVKSFIIPLFLKKVMKKTHAGRDTAADIPHFYALVISSIILFAGFMAANIKLPEFQLISPLYFGVSIAVIIISLWLITIKHTVLSNVINFITMENGIFLLSLSAAQKMPVIINLGVLLDVFIAVFILGMLVREINTQFNDLEVSHISELKDYE